VTPLVALPVVVPLLSAALSLVAWRHRHVQRWIGLGALASVLVVSVALLVRADDNGVLVSQAGGWPAPIGISLVVDRFAAIMLVVAATTFLCVLVYAIGQPGTEQTAGAFHPLYLVLASGVSLAFVTGDLFNLFVAFEMTLSASYVLITLGGRSQQVRTGMTYVVISLVASMLFLTTVGLVYAATGTLNMADLAERIPLLPAGLQTTFAVLLLLVFGIKAGLFPLFFWLPDSYPTAPSPITALFAGLLTKVGVYAIIRTQTLLFPSDARPVGLLLALAGLTMVVGVLGAIAQGDVKRILSFHIISQVGYMVMGLAFFTVAGLAAAVLFIVHNVVVKSTLLLTGGLIEHVGGSSRLARVGGLQHRAPMLAVLFLLPALSIAGIPPLSGFVGKLALVESGFDVGQYTVVGVSLAVSLLTLFSMTKIWAGSFWGEPDEDPEHPPQPVGRLGGPPLMVLGTAVLVAAGVGIAVAAGPLYDLSVRAAADLVDPSAYVEAVFDR
jgi:multicomponent Na+:H+ antiporter subunit D